MEELKRRIHELDAATEVAGKLPLPLHATTCVLPPHACFPSRFLYALHAYYRSRARPSARSPAMRAPMHVFTSERMAPRSHTVMSQCRSVPSPDYYRRLQGSRGHAWRRDDNASHRCLGSGTACCRGL